MKKLLLVCAVLALLAQASWAATNAFNVNMVVRAPITIVQVNALDFGTIDLPTTTTTYTVNPNGTGPHSAGLTSQAAQFTVSGENAALATASVTTPINATSGANTLSFALTLSQTAITFGGTATTLYVGGSVSVTPTTPTGTYAGSSTLTILYN